MDKLDEIIKSQETFDKDYSNISIKDCKNVALRFAEHILKEASENVDVTLEPMGWLAEQHLSDPLIAGIDYELNVSRESIKEVLNKYL